MKELGDYPESELWNYVYIHTEIYSQFSSHEIQIANHSIPTDISFMLIKAPCVPSRQNQKTFIPKGQKLILSAMAQGSTRLKH